MKYFLLPLLLLAGCATRIDPPALPALKGKAIKPFSAVPNYTPMRPVEPRDWRQLNREVTPR